MLTKIKPASEMSQNFTGEKTTKNHAFVALVSKNNVLNTIETIKRKRKSFILKEMADKGEIMICGAYYDMKSGEVAFM
ncbi:MAG TPA: carbonic anhydrase [Bacteroidia bacterium]|nr:carbonic anhydrase [Bacteroidia bacterium]